MNKLFESKPIIISALHFPSFRLGSKYSMSWLEDYVLNNLSVFSKGGMPAVILQDETYNEGRARPETLTVMASVSRLAKREFPEMNIGIIIEAHDPVAALAVAHASGASFVRIKVFSGAMLKSTGVQQGCGVEALDYRNSIGRNDIAVLADVHDRTGFPLLDIPIERGASWSSKIGADGLILTGSDHEMSMNYIRDVRNSGIQKPLLVGGGVTHENVIETLSLADGVIASSVLMRNNVEENQIKWDLDKILRFMDLVKN